MMNNGIVVSVVCLVYNHKSFIEDCLNGLVNQETNFSYEILIHDDASTDGTQEIIKTYEKKFPEIIKPIYQTENQYSKGVKPTFKFNFPRAKGKYIAFCEGDDYWIDPLKLQKQVDFLEQNPDYNFSMGKVYKYYEDSKKRVFKDSVNPAIKDTFLLKDYIKGAFSQTSSFLMRNNFDIPDWIYKVHAADQSIVLIATSDKKIKYHDDFFSVYRINSESISFNTNHKTAYEKSVFFLNTINEFTRFKYDSIIKMRKLNNFLFFKMKQLNNPVFDIAFKVIMRTNSYLIKRFL